MRARGKRTQYTSVSLRPRAIQDFGEALYRLERSKLDEHEHSLIEHEDLLSSLRETIANEEKEERTRAIQALRYARRRAEGLIDWTFDTSGVDRKALITWAYDRVQPYFRTV